MNILLRIFRSRSGISSMRVMSMLCCLAAIVLAFVGVHKDLPDYSGLTLLCSAFLSAAFGGKVLQKNIEVKQEPKSSQEDN